MKNSFSCAICMLILWLMFPFITGIAGSLRTGVKEANKFYESKNYEEALKKFMDLEVEHPGDALLNYDIGNTLYQQKRYDEAIEHYQKAILNGAPELRAQASYNIGDSYYRKGMQSESAGKLGEAIDFMKKGVEEYKSSLKINSDDRDTKCNIEFVQREIKRLLNKMKEQSQQQQGQNQQQQNQQQQQQQQQGGQGQQQQGQKNQQQQQQQGAQAKQEKENEGQKQAGEKENESRKQAAEKENEGQQQSQSAQAGKNEEQKGEQKKGQQLSKQEAERLLSNLPDKEKRKIQKQQDNRGYLGEVEKNW